MAIGTYSELQSAVANWLAREGDSTITSMLPNAIALVEAKLNRNLRVGQMEASAPLTGTNGVFTLPTDYNGWRRVAVSPYGPLEFLTPEMASAYFPTAISGAPQYFTVQGSTLTTYPAVNAIVLDYYRTIPALSDSNTTNWLLTSHPDVYLFMTLSEVNAFTKDAEAALLWNQRGMTAVEEIKAQDKDRRFASASIRSKGPTP